VDLYEDGRVRLLGADWRTYCAQLPQDLHAELTFILAEESFLESLDTFGTKLTCPDHLLLVEIEVRYKFISRSARIDALSGQLLLVIELLEEGLKEVFGPDYQISILERLAELTCAPGSDGRQ
jgi:hypothetical protein